MRTFTSKLEPFVTVAPFSTSAEPMRVAVTWKLEQLGPDGWATSASGYVSQAAAKDAGRLLLGLLPWRVDEETAA